MHSLLENEIRMGFPKARVCGIDEVGRGCLAGPVVTVAAVLPPIVDWNEEVKKHPWLVEVTDSKALSASQRDSLFIPIQSWLSDFSIAQATAAEIDRLNIHHATLLAMTRAYHGLKKPVDCILIDGKFVPNELKGPNAQAIVKGDKRSLAIACASILAKVTRDRMMIELKARYPEYAFEVHKGYPTAFHKKAIREHGLLDIHRQSFKTS